MVICVKKGVVKKRGGVELGERSERRRGGGVELGRGVELGKECKEKAWRGGAEKGAKGGRERGCEGRVEGVKGLKGLKG